MQEFEAAIFDVDGTLIDSVDAHATAWQRAFEHFGRHVSFEEVRNQIGKGGDQLMPVFLPEDVVRERGEEIQKYRSDLFKREFLPDLRPFPRVRELFERLLRDGYRVALASSAKGDELEAYKKLAGIDDLLDAETSSDDADQSKPHPDIFLAAIRKSGAAPARAVVVGDTPYDAEAALRAGSRIIGVLCGGSPEDWLRSAGCEWIYRDPAALLDGYEQSPLKRPDGSRPRPPRSDNPAAT